MKTSDHQARGYALVLLAAALWATLGLIFKQLLDVYALPGLTVSFLRAALGGGAILAGLAVWQRSALQVARPDVLFLLGFGTLGVAAFFVVYVKAVDLAGVTVAVILLYTAPAWVALFSALFLNEPLNLVKMICIAMSMIGCALVARVYRLDSVHNAGGLLAGIASGITYALYSVFIKAGVRRYPMWTVLGYGYTIGAVLLVPFQSAQALIALGQPGVWLWLLLLVAGPTIGSGACFAAGLRYVPASNASVVATVEPLIAAGLAHLFLHEQLEPAQLLGGGLILAAVIWLAQSERKQGITKEEYAGQRSNDSQSNLRAS